MNRILSYAFLLLFISSCVTKNVAELNLSIPPKNVKELITKVNSKNKYPEWLALKGKIRLMLKKDNEVSLGITISVKKDSIIWASVTAPFGFELFRAVLTKDSVFYINRTNKTYFKKKITHISKIIKTDITFNEIQKMITANPEILNSRYSFDKIDDEFLLSSQDYNYTISNSYRISKGVMIVEGNSLSYSYSNFSFENNFPEQLEIEVKSSSEAKFNLKLNYSKVVFDQQQKMPIKIPISYVEIK